MGCAANSKSVRTTRALLEEAEETAKELREEVLRQQRENQQLQLQHEQVCHERDLLNADLDDAHAEREKALETGRRSTFGLEELQRQLATSEASNISHVESRSKLQARCSRLEGESRSLRDELLAAAASQASALKNAERERTAAEAREGAMCELRARASQLATHHDAILSEREAAIQERKRAREELSTASLELRRTQEKLTEASSEANQLREELLRGKSDKELSKSKIATSTRSQEMVAGGEFAAGRPPDSQDARTQNIFTAPPSTAKRPIPVDIQAISACPDKSTTTLDQQVAPRPTGKKSNNSSTTGRPSAPPPVPRSSTTVSESVKNKEATSSTKPGTLVLPAKTNGNYTCNGIGAASSQIVVSEVSAKGSAIEAPQSTETPRASVASNTSSAAGSGSAGGKKARVPPPRKSGPPPNLIPSQSQRASTTSASSVASTVSSSVGPPALAARKQADAQQLPIKSAPLAPWDLEDDEEDANDIVVSDKITKGDSTRQEPDSTPSEKVQSNGSAAAKAITQGPDCVGRLRSAPSENAKEASNRLVAPVTTNSKPPSSTGSSNHDAASSAQLSVPPVSFAASLKDVDPPPLTRSVRNSKVSMSSAPWDDDTSPDAASSSGRIVSVTSTAPPKPSSVNRPPPPVQGPVIDAAKALTEKAGVGKIRVPKPKRAKATSEVDVAESRSTHAEVIAPPAASATKAKKDSAKFATNDSEAGNGDNKPRPAGLNPPTRRDPRVKIFHFDYSVFDFLNHEALRTPSESGCSEDDGSRRSELSVSQERPKAQPPPAARKGSSMADDRIQLGAVHPAVFSFPKCPTANASDQSASFSTQAKALGNTTESLFKSGKSAEMVAKLAHDKEPVWAPVDAYGRPLSQPTKRASLMSGGDSDGDSLGDDDWGRMSWSRGRAPAPVRRSTDRS